MLMTHEDIVDVYLQTKADMRRFKPFLACLQVKTTPEGCDLARKATLANFFIQGLA